MALMILNSERNNGPMTGNKAFYKQGMSDEEIQADLLRRRNTMAFLYGFSGTSIIVPKQDEKFEYHTPGQLFDATEFVCDNKDTDLWNTDEPCDVMLLRNKAFKTVPGLVLAYPVSDCAVFIVVTKEGDVVKTVSIVHCGGYQIDRGLPAMAIEAIKDKLGLGIRDNDKISIYVGPFAQPRSYVYDTGIPKFVTNSQVWDGCLTQQNGLVYVDMKHAIEKQIQENYGKLLMMSNLDTVTDDRFYSNCAGRLDPSKNGRHLVGAYCKKR